MLPFPENKDKTCEWYCLLLSFRKDQCKNLLHVSNTSSKKYQKKLLEWGVS